MPREESEDGWEFRAMGHREDVGWIVAERGWREKGKEEDRRELGEREEKEGKERRKRAEREIRGKNAVGKEEEKIEKKVFGFREEKDGKRKHWEKFRKKKGTPPNLGQLQSLEEFWIWQIRFAISCNGEHSAGARRPAWSYHKERLGIVGFNWKIVWMGVWSVVVGSIENALDYCVLQFKFDSLQLRLICGRTDQKRAHRSKHRIEVQFILLSKLQNYQ